MSDTVLVKLDLARAALAECRTVMEAKQIADIAEAARVYLERTNASVETVNRATEIRALAERQMGEFLKEMPKATGAKGVGPIAVPEENRNQTPTLAAIGITKKQSARAQKLADIPAPEFAERIAVAKASGGKLSMTKLVEERRVKTRPKHVESESEFKVRIQRVISFCLQAIPTGMEKAAAAVLRVLADQLEKT
jgi:hypothetical protein